MSAAVFDVDVAAYFNRVSNLVTLAPPMYAVTSTR